MPSQAFQWHVPSLLDLHLNQASALFLLCVFSWFASLVRSLLFVFLAWDWRFTSECQVDQETWAEILDNIRATENYKKTKILLIKYVQHCWNIRETFRKMTTQVADISIKIYALCHVGPPKNSMPYPLLKKYALCPANQLGNWKMYALLESMP